MVNVTDVRVRRINQEGRMKAIVSVTVDDAFVIHDVKVVEGQSGLFVAMPSRKMPDGDYRDIAHPINSEARSIMQQHVLEAYDRALAELEAEQEEDAAIADEEFGEEEVVEEEIIEEEIPVE
jgi:stage V sporulation protein G